MPLLVLLAAVLSCCVGLTGQRTWIVDLNNGPGTDFPDLPAAVAAAAPGDIIRVRPAPGLMYEAPIVDRPLSILGDQQMPPVVIGTLEVHNIPARTEFSFSGFKLGTVETTLAFRLQRGVVCQDNAGRVNLDRVEYGYDPAILPSGFSDPRGILFERCALVTISRSTLWSCQFLTTVRDSTLIATDSRFRESTPRAFPVETIFLQRSTATLIDCEAIGTDGGYSSAYGVFYPSPGIVVCGATVSVSGHSQVRGGYFYGGGPSTGIMTTQVFGYGPTCSPFPPNLPEVFRDPRSSILGTIGTYAIEHFDPVPGVRWGMTSGPASLSTTQYTNPNSTTVLVAGSLLPQPVPGPLGTLFLDPSFLLVLDVAVTGTNGEHTWTIPVPPNLPAPTNLPIQAIELTHSGGLMLTNVIIPGVF